MIVLENQPIIISNLSSAVLNRKPSLAGNVHITPKDKAENHVSSGQKGFYRVNISQEAKDLQAKEGNTFKNDDAEKTKKSESEESSSAEVSGETSESQNEQSKIDELIKKLQEEITKIKEKIAALTNNNSEAAKTQRKALEAQLIELIAQLLSLIEKKMGSA